MAITTDVITGFERPAQRGAVYGRVGLPTQTTQSGQVPVWRFENGSVVPSWSVPVGIDILPNPGDLFDDWDVIITEPIVGQLFIPNGQAYLISGEVTFNDHIIVGDNTPGYEGPPARLGLRSGSKLRYVGPYNPENYNGGGIEFDPVADAEDYGIWIQHHGILDARGTVKSAGWFGSRWDILNPTQAPPDWDLQNDEMYEAPFAGGARLANEWDGVSLVQRKEVPAGKASAVLVKMMTDVGAPQQVIDDWVENGIPNEIINVTRDCEIEGPGHIHMHSHNPQIIEGTTFRNLGVSNSNGQVLGRYALHWHHGQSFSRGSRVTGCAFIGGDGNQIVPHASHGVDIIDNVVVNTGGNGFWWDFEDRTNDVFVSHLCVAGVTDNHVNSRARDVISLHKGLNMRIEHSRASGGDNRLNGGFDWGTGNFPEMWHFRTFNIAHNAGFGTRLWNNAANSKHFMGSCIIYNGGAVGILAGAYTNGNRYADYLVLDVTWGVEQSTSNVPLPWGELFDGEFGDGTGQRYTNCFFRATRPVLVNGHNISKPENGFVEYHDCEFHVNGGGPPIWVATTSNKGGTPRPFDRFIRCTKNGGVPITPDDVFYEVPGYTSLQGSEIQILNSEIGGGNWSITIDNSQKVVTPI